jgi:hypothetical protein
VPAPVFPESAFDVKTTTYRVCSACPYKTVMQKQTEKVLCIFMLMERKLRHNVVICYSEKHPILP